MAGVDNRIVTMQFNNREFESNARTSMTTLQKLKESMNFGSIVGGTIRGLGTIESALSKIGLKTPFAPLIRGANVGLSGIGTVLDKLGMKNPFVRGVQGAGELQRAAQVAAGPQGMGVLDGAVTGVSNKFLALSTIAITALSNITNRAINAGTTFLKSFTFAPIQQGLEEYELNLKSMQTIQANTDRPLSEVEESLDILNKYSDQTIYNFAEMARNVGTFTAAGVDLKTSVSSIKGIANMAALSGSTSEQAASAMYQLSQAIAAGKVGLMDWNSVVNAGMGGKKLQGALAQTAIAMGEIDKSQVKGTKSGEQLTIMGQSFRESIMASPGQESWLTSGVLTNALAALDGRYSVAALSQEKLANGTLKYKNKAEALAAVEKARNAAAKEGIVYTDEQFKELQKLSTAAFESATKVKTLGQVFDIAKETIASGWSASFRSIFGGLDEAKKLFTGMSEGLNGLIEENALARNEMLAAWKEGGGRDTLIDGLKNSWEALLGILGPIKDGFRDIFPAQTADSLLDMTRNFESFTQKLIPSKATMADIRDIAGGVFSVLRIGRTILVGVIDGFKTMFSSVGAGNGSFLDLLATVGRAVTKFSKFLEESGLVSAFFEGLGRVLSVPLALLRGVGDIIGGIFGGFDSSSAESVGKAVDGIGKRLSGLEVVGERLRSFFSAIGQFFANLGGHIADALAGIGDVVAGAFTAETFGKTLDVVNTTLLGGLVLLIRNFFAKGVSIDLTGGLFDGIKETLGAATSALENMQLKLKADVLMKIAISIGVLAASLLVLSMINPSALAKALGAMSAGFGILIGALAVLMKVMGPVGIVQMYVVTSAMTKMAFSILLLSVALKTLAGIKFGDMLRGLVGLAGMMYILSKAMKPLMANTKGMAKMTFSLIMLGVAINIMAVALKVLSSMSWEEMLKGLAGLAGMMLILAGALKIMPDMQAEAIGLLALGAAMNLLAIAMKIFATMSWGEMVKGMAALAGSLLIISYAISTMPKTMMFQAVALLAVAGAMVVLAGALKIMGSMGWEEIAKGLVVLAGAMLILAIGLQTIGIVGTIGAAGLLMTAAALAIIVPMLVALGAMSWESIGKSMVMLVGLFTVLGVAATLAGLQILVLGAGMLLLGAGVALLGAGLLSAATAFGMLVATGSAGIQVLTGWIATIIKAIPAALAAFAEGLVRFAVVIGRGAPKIAQAFGRILSNILTQVRNNIPKIGQIFMRLIDVAAQALGRGVPKLARAGLDLILGVLSAAASRVGQIVNVASDLIVNFLNSLAKNLPRIIDAGIRLVISFVNGVANGIRNNKDEMADAGRNLATALIEAVVAGLESGAGLITDAAMAAARSAWEAARDFFKIGSPSKLMRDTVGIPITQGWAGGIKDGGGTVVKEIEDLGTTTVSRMSDVMRGIDDAFALDPNLNPTITPVLDLTALTQEANKMSSILATAPIMAGVSYATAADISAMTTAAAEDGTGPGGPGGPGDQYNELNLHLHSPKPIDSVEAYRGGKTLISLAKEALK